MSTTKHEIDMALDRVKAALKCAEADGVQNKIVETSDLRMVLEELERLGGIDLED